jgi:hypothetical protein
VRAAAGAAFAPGAYGAAILSTGASHADPRFVAVGLVAHDAGRAKVYHVGGRADSVWIDSVARGVVYGHLYASPFRYGPREPKAPMLRQLVWREVRASFAATPAPPPAAPALTDDAQERALRRALDGFAMTWAGAVNGDGPRDSVLTPAAARRFLRARWGGVLRVDSVAVTGGRFYLRVSGAARPVTCVLASSEAPVECTRGAARERPAAGRGASSR